MAETSAPYRWLDGNLTWAQAVDLPFVPADVVAKAFNDAWESWASVCGITPTQRSQAEAHFANVVASAGEGYDQGFDTANQILALSQLPTRLPITAQLTQVFNRRSAWTADMVQGVVAHEIGHSLGLIHDKPGTLMYAYYTPGVKSPQAADVAQAVLRYGPRKAIALPGPPPKITPFPLNQDPLNSSNIVQIEINVPAPGKYILSMSMVPK